MDESQQDSSRHENDIEITDLDAGRPRRCASTHALRRATPWLWGAAWISCLLLFVLLVSPGTVPLLLRSQNHQLCPTATEVPPYNVFLGADQAAIYVARNNVLAALQTTSGRPLWHVQTDSPLLGNPELVRGILYAASETTVYAIRASTGQLLWHQTPEDSLLRGQPLLGAGIVSMALADGSLATWQASTGRPLWHVALKNEALFPAAIAQGMVFADTSGGSVVAVRTTTGTLLWKQPALKGAPHLPSIASPTEVSVDLPSGTFSKRQTQDGRLLWRHDFSTAAILTSGEIAFGQGDDRVYVSQQNRRVPGGSLTVWGASTDMRLWQAATGTGFLPPLVVGDVVYTGSQYGPLEARRVEDGSLLWRYLPGSLPLVVMTVAQETVYLGSSLGTVEAVSADTGSVRWRYDADGPISDITQDAHAAVVIGSGNGFIARLREETGSLLWQASSLGEPTTLVRSLPWRVC